MLVEEIINEWFGYKGIVSDVMEQYKLKIKEMTLFKENFMFYNIFLFFCLLLVYQLNFNFFKNACVFIYNKLEIFSLFFSVLFFVFFLILKNYIEKQQINSENKFWFYIFLMMTMIVLYPLRYQIKFMKIKIFQLLILALIITLIFFMKKVHKKKLLDRSTWNRSTLDTLLNWDTLVVFFIVVIGLKFFVLIVFLFQIYLIATYEYEDKNEKKSLKWWIYIMLIIIMPLGWEIPITVILFKLLYQKYEKKEEDKKKNKESNEKNTSIEKYKIFTLNHIFEDFCTKNYNFILKVTSYIYSGWMFLQLMNVITVNENKDIKIDYLKVTFCVILYLILNVIYSKIKIKNNVLKKVGITFYVIVILFWYHLGIRKNIQSLLFFIFLNILIFIVYFFIAFIESNTRKEILKRNMQVRENILMNIMSNFENNNDKEYKIEILKSLSLEVNKKIVFLRVVKWGFIIYILFQIISRYLYKYFTFETLSLFEELIKKFFSIQFSPEKIFNESIIFLLFVTGMFIVSQIIEILLPYKLIELIYLNETINNLLLKEQKKG
mgnify:CR=1 FL=1